jgi:hypothetical protein
MTILMSWWLGLALYGFRTAQGKKIAMSRGATSYVSMIYRYDVSNSFK